MDIFQIVNTIKEFFISIKDFLVSLNGQEIVSVLKVVSAVLAVLFFVGIVYLIIKLNLISKIRKASRLLIVPSHISKKITKRWVKIEQRLESGQEAELKLAIIEADKFFDDILKRIGYLGKDMGERLKKINSSQMANIDDIWSAHKIRNNIVHDVDYKLTSIDAEKAIKAYKKALEELEVL